MLKLKSLKNNLLVLVVIAITAGVILGNLLTAPWIRIFVTFNAIFGNFLDFIIPLIIVGLIVPAIGNIGKGAGKLLLITTLIAYGSTVLSGLLSYGVSVLSFPKLLEGEKITALQDAEKELQPYFEILIPELFEVMSGLILAFIVGIALSKFELKTIGKFFDEFEKIIMWVIEKLIVPLLPLFIFGIFLEMSYSGQAYVVLKTFLKIIGVIFVMHVGLLVLQYLAAGSIANKNPFKLMKSMLPAYFTALGTQSSAATIPVTLERAEKSGIDPKIAGFTIPLCATIHLSGSTLKIVACAIALLILQDINIEFWQFFGFICLLGVTMVAAPGVPGGAIMAATAVLSSVLEFNTDQLSLMIALYIAMDSFGTACNVMGDGAIATVVDKFNQDRSAQTVSSS